MPMNESDTTHDLRRRFWVEAVLAAVTMLLTFVTLVWPQWIEDVMHVEPDAGSGSAEWAVVLLFAAASVISAALARHEWRRARIA